MRSRALTGFDAYRHLISFKVSDRIDKMFSMKQLAKFLMIFGLAVAGSAAGLSLLSLGIVGGNWGPLVWIGGALFVGGFLGTWWLSLRSITVSVAAAAPLTLFVFLLVPSLLYEGKLSGALIWIGAMWSVFGLSFAGSWLASRRPVIADGAR